MGMAAAMVLTACAGGDDRGKETEQSSAPGEVCGGLFAGDAGAALRTALGSGPFQPSVGGESAGDAAGKLAAEPLDDDAWREHRLCSVHKGSEAGIADLTVTGERVSPAIADAPHTRPEVARYAVGRGAWADANRAVVYVDCVSSRLAGADGSTPAVVAVSAWNRTFPQGDVAKYREANLTLAHAGAVAVVKELGCRDNAGLTDRPAVQEVPAG
ncbi:hypothetical protein ACLF6K_26990 [Streptomyces xanthophaeus]|uniref:hypothetical protein n=1 Tax=Streptomyces xanthophaeus TaxID=67385 RepID=UPI0039901454